MVYFIINDMWSDLGDILLLVILYNVLFDSKSITEFFGFYFWMNVRAVNKLRNVRLI